MDIHKKAIDIIGLDISEPVMKNMEMPVQFNRDNNYYNGLELNNLGFLETSSTVDWGITKIADLTDSFSRFVCKNVDNRKDAFYSAGERGTITSPWIYVKNLDDASEVYLKINDVLLEELQYFNVRVLTANNQYGKNAKEILSVNKSNLVEIAAALLDSYIQFIIEMPPRKVINNLEVYVRYVEKENHLLHVSEVPRGEMITKVYDMVTVSNYVLKYIRASSATNLEDIKVYVRGIREDEFHAVATDWYPCELDENLTDENPHVFYNYRFFQFKIEILNMDASIKIDDFVFEVI
jgi:hypothetical protein